jgi:hypothetical protein
VNKRARLDAEFDILLGVLMTALCGGCTLWISNNGGIYGLQYIVGGIPTLIGLWLIVEASCAGGTRPTTVRAGADE